MRYRLMSSSIALLLFAATAASAQPQPRDTPGATRTAKRLAPGDARAHASHGAATRDTLSAADSALIARGKEIVTTLCVACHVEQSPHKLAPPLSHVSNRYRMQLVHRDSALARIWRGSRGTSVSAPDADAGHQRFGVMAPLPIPEDQRRAAAAYVWSLSEERPGCRSMQGMQGMRRCRAKGMKGSMRRIGHARHTHLPLPERGSR
jgi:cytochrome c5